jgi:hypothetical protein
MDRAVVAGRPEPEKYPSSAAATPTHHATHFFGTSFDSSLRT